jgi:hypothetical protein
MGEMNCLGGDHAGRMAVPDPVAVAVFAGLHTSKPVQRASKREDGDMK